MQFISQALIKENSIEKRTYQEILVRRVLENGNTLIVAPTALGKTIIAILLAAEKLNENQNNKIIFLSPTKPLTIQHEESFKKFLNIPNEKINSLTGTINSEQRKQIWENSNIISATPQTIENDLAKGNINLKDASLIIFDECHRAIGEYAYVFIAQKYLKQNKSGLVLGLTASPGGNEEKINDVCRNLLIKNIEIRTHKDLDVKDYVKEINVEWNKVELPILYSEIKKHMNKFMNEQIVSLQRIGYNIKKSQLTQTELLLMQRQIRQDLISKSKSSPSIYSASSKVATLLKLIHAVLLLETQGVNSLNDYFEKMIKESEKACSTKAIKTIIKSKDVQNAIKLTRKSISENIIHPKLEQVTKIIKNQLKEKKSSKIIIFNHYRSSINNLIKHIKKEIPNLIVEKFIGQASKGNEKGLTQKKQKEIIGKFKNNEITVLCCSSVAEEGLDIPSVELVVFFEPVPSEIRTIQRIGRTGRIAKGKVIILMAKRTRDEAFYWASKAKEKKMYSTLKTLQSTSKANSKTKSSVSAYKNQTTLMKYSNEMKDKILIYYDTRENANSIINYLEEKQVVTKKKQLEIGDYVLSDRIIVERKTTEDFLASLIDGRLFQQAVKMNEAYSSPLIIIEGNSSELFVLRKIHRNAIIGALTSLAIDYNTPYIFTSGPTETAEYLYIISKREQLGKDKDIKIRIGRKGLTVLQQQQFVVESLPLVGPSLAKNLLRNFKSIKGIIDANEKELQEVENLGKIKAKKIKKLIEEEYNEKN